MIRPSSLSAQDVGRNVTYHRPFCKREFGTLSSWNDKYVFVKFKGPTGEACELQDVTFDHETVEDKKHYTKGVS